MLILTLFIETPAKNSNETDASTLIIRESLSATGIVYYIKYMYEFKNATC